MKSMLFKKTVWAVRAVGGFLNRVTVANHAAIEGCRFRLEVGRNHATDAILRLPFFDGLIGEIRGGYGGG